ncbi:MAG TPA: DUF1287 domain-containing protein [Thermoanaerobaculia bacterium]|nr:DUF1287 domain-containing protein [Thermoanaerobaculia bacterium]
MLRRTVIASLLVGVLAVAEAEPQPIGPLLARAAVRQVGITTLYDPSYVRLPYPNGDVPLDRGVCADVVVRAFREVGVDLQMEIHEDMRDNFGAYPRNWGLKAPDRNIDHRRVPNLMRYFERRGKHLPSDAGYQPGDVVAWRLPNGLYHIGVVTGDPVPGENRPFVVHNIGSGARKEDVLYAFRVIGHYRW